MLADCELSQLLVHSQLCEDERIAFALQIQLLGCAENIDDDVVDGLVVEVAAAHNALAASIFAQDSMLPLQRKSRPTRVFLNLPRLTIMLWPEICTRQK